MSHIPNLKDHFKVEFAGARIVIADVELVSHNEPFQQGAFVAMPRFVFMLKIKGLCMETFVDMFHNKPNFVRIEFKGVAPIDFKPSWDLDRNTGKAYGYLKCDFMLCDRDIMKEAFELLGTCPEGLNFLEGINSASLE